MSISDEIEKLSKLRDVGALTDEGFAKAKSLLLDQAARGRGTSGFTMTDPLRNFVRSLEDRWLGGGEGNCYPCSVAALCSPCYAALHHFVLCCIQAI
jgi:hypothetical protein